MREIKFRVWSPIYKEFWMVEFGQEFVLKKTDVISQFTGLHDKNGKEIWEGDICNVKRLPFLGDPLYHPVKVMWSEPHLSWIFRGWYRERGVGDSYGIRIEQIEDIEVIGDVYENPELLKATA